VSSPDHPRFRDDVAAYLLGALEEAETRDFETHMESCPDCRRELEQLRPAADALPRSVEQLEPPPSLKSSLMDVVEVEARERDPAAARVPWTQRLRGLIPRTGGLRVVMAVTLLAIGLAVGFEVSELGNDSTTQRTIAAKMDTKRVPALASASLRYENNGAHGGVLRTHGLPALGRGRVYQAWIQLDGRVVPQPTFMVGSDGQGAVALPDDLSDASAVLVTRERSGGAQRPSEKPILSVTL
jgi:Anti-sigma-K factor rskA/Putative zinc-finger